MTADSRYWDHDRCAWVAYEAAAQAAVPQSPEGLAAAMPEQRDDEPAKVTAD
jgi:hypothetical protein